MAQRLTNLTLVTKLCGKARIQTEVFQFQSGAFSFITSISQKYLTWEQGQLKNTPLKILTQYYYMVTDKRNEEKKINSCRSLA